MRTPRVFCPARLALGARAPLDEAQVRRLETVRRLGAGAYVLAFNGSDGEWRARLEAEGRKGLALVVEAQTRAPAPRSPLTVAFSPLKRQATDWLVEKATELGAGRLTPVLTSRTVADTVRTERLEVIAIEATQQCERLDPPQIDSALPLARWLDAPDVEAILYCAEAGGGVGSLLEALSERSAPRTCAVLIGPEGGFDAVEHRLLSAHPLVTPVHLGPRILRAETAASAALTLVQAVWGDLGETPR